MSAVPVSWILAATRLQCQPVTCRQCGAQFCRIDHVRVSRQYLCSAECRAARTRECYRLAVQRYRERAARAAPRWAVQLPVRPLHRTEPLSAAELHELDHRIQIYRWRDHARLARYVATEPDAVAAELWAVRDGAGRWTPLSARQVIAASGLVLRGDWRVQETLRQNARHRAILRRISHDLQFERALEAST